jgi:hypothetical protein
MTQRFACATAGSDVTPFDAVRVPRKAEVKRPTNESLLLSSEDFPVEHLRVKRLNAQKHGDLRTQRPVNL